MFPRLTTIINTFPDWTITQCRAYRAGARAGLRADGADTAYAEEDDDTQRYYYRGYADAAGPDVEAEDWYDEIVGWRIEERWWEDGLPRRY